MFTGNVPKMHESSRNLLVKSLSNHVCSNEHRLMFLSEPGPMPSPYHVSHILKKFQSNSKLAKKTLHKFQIRLCFLRLSTQRAVFELQPRFQIEEQESSSSVLFDPWSGDNQVFFLPPTLYFSDDRKLFSLTAIIFQRKQSQAECFCSVILKILSR